MTTEVIIKANHGWPVQVMPLTATGGAVGPVQIVPAGTEGRFAVHSGQDLMIHEIQPEAEARESVEPILQFFTWQHLPDRLKVVSMPFGMMAQRLVETLPRNPERTVALRKLLEAKDCAVRAAMMV